MKALLVAVFRFSLFVIVSARLYAENNTPTKPVVFDSTDYAKGFDPTESASDSTYWTSVCKTVKILDLNGEGGQNLNINEHIVVKFSSDTEAARYVINVDTNDQDMLDLVVLPPGLRQTTSLRITGKDHSRSAGTAAAIRVYLATEPDKTPGHQVATLKVQVLPLRSPKLGIWTVSDPTSSNSGNGDSNPRTVATPARILNAFLYCRRVYRPACIVFETVRIPEDTATGELDLNYDISILNSYFDLPQFVLNWVTLRMREFEVLQDGVPKVAEVNVAFVKRFTQNGLDPDLNILGLTFTRHSISVNAMAGLRAANVDGDLNRTCAHEIGHQLNLSVRPLNPNPPENLGATAFAKHDSGPFPTDEAVPPKYWVGLLYPTITCPKDIGHPVPRFEGTEWLSRRDWSEANSRAATRPLPWTPLRLGDTPPPE